MRRCRSGLTVVPIACAVLACATGPEVACTLMDCDHGLVVHLSGFADVIAVEAETSSGGPVFSWPCEPSSDCGLIMFESFMPEVVTIRVVTTRDTTTQRFDPAYVDYFPNGRSCAPTCPQATVTIAREP